MSEELRKKFMCEMLDVIEKYSMEYEDLEASVSGAFLPHLIGIYMLQQFCAEHCEEHILDLCDQFGDAVKEFVQLNYEEYNNFSLTVRGKKNDH